MNQLCMTFFKELTLCHQVHQVRDGRSQIICGVAAICSLIEAELLSPFYCQVSRVVQNLAEWSPIFNPSESVRMKESDELL